MLGHNAREQLLQKLLKERRCTLTRLLRQNLSVAHLKQIEPNLIESHECELHPHVVVNDEVVHVKECFRVGAEIL